MWSGHPLPEPVSSGRRRYIDVAEQIVAAMASGQLEPGHRLPSDRQLAETMGVSRPTVREGLLALEFVGLVDMRVGEGAYVAKKAGHPGVGEQLSLPDDFSIPPEQLIEARIVLEPAVARLCAARLPVDDLHRLEQLVDRTERVADDAAQLDEFVRLGLGFHRELAVACDNQFLSSFCCSLVSVTEHPLWALVNRHAMDDRGARLGQVEEHRSILEAIGRGDPAAASEASVAHLETLRQAIFKQAEVVTN